MRPPPVPCLSLPALVAGGKRLLLATALLLLPGATQALGLGEAIGTPTLGDAISIQIPLLGDSTERLLDGECLVLGRVPGGIDPEYFPPTLRGRVEHQQRPPRLQLSSLAAVQQPIVEFRVTITCGYNISRNYLLLVSPRRDRATPAAGKPAEAAAPLPAPTAGSGKGLPDGLAAATIVLDRDQTIEDLGRHHYPGQPLRRERFMRWVVEANPNLFPESGELRQHRLAAGTQVLTPVGIPPRRPGDRQSADAPALELRGGASLPRRPAVVPTAIPPATKTRPAPRNDRLVIGGNGAQPIRDQKETMALVGRLADMMEQQLTTQTENHQRLAQLESAMVELQKYVVRLEALSRQREDQLQMERQATLRMIEEQRQTAWWQLLLAVLAGGLLGAGILFGLRRWPLPDRWRRRAAPSTAEAAVPPPVAPGAIDLLLDDSPAPPPPVPAPSVPAPPAAAPLPAVASVPPQAPDSPAAPNPGQTMERRPGGPEFPPLEFIPPTASAPPPLLVPSPFTAATDATKPADAALELVNIMMSMGLKEGAADTLVQHIRQFPRQSLHHWLKLLDLHRQAGNRDAYEQTVREMREHFNIHPADWDYGNAHELVLSLQDYPHVCSRLVEVWETPECVDYLQHLLTDNRQGTRAGFPVGAVADILLLLAMLKGDASTAAQ